MDAVRRRLNRALQETQQTLSKVNWESRDPDELVPAIQAAERALREIGTVIRQMRQLIVEADLLAWRVEQMLVTLKRERQIRLDKEYEYPSEPPPVPRF